MPEQVPEQVPERAFEAGYGELYCHVFILLCYLEPLVFPRYLCHAVLKGFTDRCQVVATAVAQAVSKRRSKCMLPCQRYDASTSVPRESHSQCSPMGAGIPAAPYPSLAAQADRVEVS